MSRFAECLPLILRWEGGWADHAEDPGGATNLGITIGTLSDWLGRPATKGDVRALTPATVAPIYEKNYWRAVGCDKLPPGVDYLVFDMAVLNGVRRTARWLQEAAGVVPVDRIIGPRTVAAVNAAGAIAIIDKLTAKRTAFYKSLPTFKTFGRGWMNRVTDVWLKAKGMAQ